MVTKISKNAKRQETQKLPCKCGGEIKMKTAIIAGKVKHSAYCTRCKNIARRPKELMK